MEHSLNEIVVVPRNGYANRLQAWASAAIMAAQLDVPVRVMWETEDAAPAPAADLLAPSLIARSFWDRGRLDDRVGGPHEELPRYLTLDADRRLVVLAGHDRGEQVFMAPLATTLLHSSRPRTLVIIAGGKFHLESDEDFDRQRWLFYRQVAWHAELDRRFLEERAHHAHYVALHVRGTDRSLEAPTSRTLRDGLRRLAATTDERSLFVAADTAANRYRWAMQAAELGFVAWSVADVDYDRSQARAGRDAMLDWRLLGAAKALVYTAASSFGAEAAVATGHVDGCIPLTASPGRQQVRSAAQIGRDAITYPRRKGWFGGQDG